MDSISMLQVEKQMNLLALLSVWGCIHMTCNHARMCSLQAQKKYILYKYILVAVMWMTGGTWECEVKQPQAGFFWHNTYIYLLRMERHVQKLSREFLC